MWGRRQSAQASTAGGEVEVQTPAEGAAEREPAATPPGNADRGGVEARHASVAAEPANGAGVQAAAAIPDEKAQAFWRGKLAAANLANAVALFLRSPAHRHYTLADLEWCLLPALARGQFLVAEARMPDGQAMPAALVLWARVSAEVDARLSAAPGYPIRLHPNEWQSGDVIWIVDAVGEPKAVQECVAALAKTAFQGRQFKVLSSLASNNSA